MEIEFEKPITPNFVRVKSVGSIPIGNLTAKEMDQYIQLWASQLKEKHKVRL